jgi:hypothetical protein
MSGYSRRRSSTYLWAAYVLLAVAITVVWVHCARTEFAVERLEIDLPCGIRLSERYCSIVRTAEGRMFSPFVRRRLVVDLARVLAWAIPDSLWSPLRDLLSNRSLAPGWLRGFLDRQQWRPEDCPLLCCAYLLIAFSVLGFMLACRRLVTILYETPAWVADLAGAVLGLALLGGNGDWHYCGYAYDFPQAFVFTLSLVGLVAGRWWFPLAFAVAAYSKETSILLIGAYVLQVPKRWSPRSWMMLALLAGTFAAIRGYLAWRYPAPEPLAGYWVLGRNLKYLTFVIFYSWSMPFFVVGLARMVALRRHFPPVLLRLSLLAVPLVGMAFCVGWLEELRQYLELLPICGLLLFHWCLHEAGYGHLLHACPLTSAPAAGPVPEAARAA